jgi:hypothetical protein
MVAANEDEEPRDLNSCRGMVTSTAWPRHNAGIHGQESGIDSRVVLSADP